MLDSFVGQGQNSVDPLSVAARRGAGQPLVLWCGEVGSKLECNVDQFYGDELEVETNTCHASLRVEQRLAEHPPLPHFSLPSTSAPASFMSYLPPFSPCIVITV